MTRASPQKKTIFWQYFLTKQIKEFRLNDLKETLTHTHILNKLSIEKRKTKYTIQ